MSEEEAGETVSAQQQGAICIRELRHLLGETQRQFALRIEVALATLVRYENGNQVPNSGMLKSLSLIADEFGHSELAAAFRQRVESKSEDAKKNRAMKRELVVSRLQTKRREIERSLRKTREQRVVAISAQGKQPTHMILWECANKQLQMAEANDSEDWLFHLSAILFGYLSFEAYINYVGDTLVPDLWLTDESIFSTTLGKLKKLLEIYDIPYPDADKRPFASIVKLQALHDEIVHPRRFGSEKLTLALDTNLLVNERHWLCEEVVRSEVRRSIYDINKLLENIHASLRNKVGEGILTPHALPEVVGA